MDISESNQEIQKLTICFQVWVIVLKICMINQLSPKILGVGFLAPSFRIKVESFVYVFALLHTYPVR